MASWTEKELEDWLCTEARFVETLENAGIDYDEGSRLFRQVSCPVGIMDMVLVGRNNVIVAELKADQAGPSAFCQILRYTGYVRWRHHCLARRLDGGRTVYAANEWESEKCATHGVIVAPSFDDAVMWAVAEVPSIDLLCVTTSFAVDVPSFAKFNSDGNRSCRRECMDDQFDLAWVQGVEPNVLAELRSDERQGR